MNTQPVRVALYARVSTTNKWQDLDTQLLPLKRHCNDRGWEIYQIYTDMMSWSKESRPSLNQLLKDAEDHKFDTVIVFRLGSWLLVLSLSMRISTLLLQLDPWCLLSSQHLLNLREILLVRE
jgi:DNA invertase Pin-like site-specific DNA recombinase